MSPRNDPLFEDLPRSCPGIWRDRVDCSCDPGHGELTELQRSMLDLEAKYSNGYDLGEKLNAILELMGPGMHNRYYQRLDALLDRKPALEYDGPLVNRLRARRATPKWRRGAA